ncbi:aspartate dehydrogenase domain-containing protein [Mailhella massiliensis]|uniref:aspartate dehydrogenase domain-containing protein n=1 Tax=Mailhella massiliensis TaxID=1903261 RepID=UPI00097D141C|nr:aspartate dehydrogenase domain-containing protein [Mailhella massiliensis]
MKKTLGIIGCGAMGRLIGLHVQDRLAHLYDLAGVSSRTEAHAETLGRELSVPAMPLDTLISRCDVLVESASAAAMPSIVRACLAAQKEVICLSVGGFSLDAALLDEVTRQSCLVHVPSGAVAGLDGIRSMREMGLESLALTTVKRPESLGLADISALPPAGEGFSPEARLVFEGNAAEAIRRFPANVNIAVALSLAGNGFESTTVRLIADPSARGTRHSITARAGSCSLEVAAAPAPLRENPRSSALAMYSVPALLRQLASPLRLAG